MGACGTKLPMILANFCGDCRSNSIMPKISRKKSLDRTDLISLDADMVVLARQQWTDARKARKNLGHSIIVKFLAERPDARRVFHLPKCAIEHEQLAEFGFLKLHGSKLENFLTGFVEGADNDPIEAKNQCRTLGRMHFYKGVAFDQEMFDDFKYYVVDAIFEQAPKPITAEQREPWLMLLDYFNKQLLHGILHESVAKNCLTPNFSLRATLSGIFKRNAEEEDPSSMNGGMGPEFFSSYWTGTASSRNTTIGKKMNNRRGSVKSLNINHQKDGHSPLLARNRNASGSSNPKSPCPSAKTTFSYGQRIIRPFASSKSTVIKKFSMASSPRAAKAKSHGSSPPSPNASNNCNPKVRLLNWDEREILRIMWSRIEEADGQKMVVDLLMTYPHLCQYFGLPEEQATLDILEDHVVVKVHGCRLYGYLDNMVHLLLNEKHTHAVHVTQRVGQIHYHRGVHFTANNWLAFKRVIVKHCQEALPNKTAYSMQMSTVVLEKLLRFITQNMRLGFIQVALQGQVDAPSVRDVTEEQLKRLQCEEDNLPIMDEPINLQLGDD